MSVTSLGSVVCIGGFLLLAAGLASESPGLVTGMGLLLFVAGFFLTVAGRLIDDGKGRE